MIAIDHRADFAAVRFVVALGFAVALLTWAFGLSIGIGASSIPPTSGAVDAGAG